MTQTPNNKRKELETFEDELDTEHTQKVLEIEHSQQLNSKKWQKVSEGAFQQYLSPGRLQIAERRDPNGRRSPMDVNIDMLEQMNMMHISDQGTWMSFRVLCIFFPSLG